MLPSKMFQESFQVVSNIEKAWIKFDVIFEAKRNLNLNMNTKFKDFTF